MRLFKNKLVWVLLIIVAAIVSYLYLRQDEETIYLTEPVKISDIEVSILSDGKMEALEQIDVGAQVSGQIKKMHVKLGDKVKKGQLIAEIDDLPQQNAIKDGEARLKNVIASKMAKKAQMINAQINVDRQRRLIKTGATTQSDLDLAEANLQVYEAELDALEAQISQARIALDTAKIDLTYTKIVAPINGIVVATIVKEGQTVNAAQTAPTIVKVANLSMMTIKAQISEADVTKVRLGMKAYFTILGDSKTSYEAVLKQIEPATEVFQNTVGNSITNVNEAVYYNGLFHVKNEEGRFYIDMTTQVYLIIDEAKQVPIVPTMALHYNPSHLDRPELPSDDYNTIWVKEPSGELKVRLVKIGISNNVLTEIKEGLEIGDQVVISEILPNYVSQTRSAIRRTRGGG